MNLLPHWVLTDKFPAFYDSESATAIEQTAKVYGAMQDLITDYNAFVDRVNQHITDFNESASKNYDEFKVALRQEFQDFIDIIELKLNKESKTISDLITEQNTNIHTAIKSQDSKIGDAVLFMKYNLTDSIDSVLNEMRISGGFSEEVMKSFSGLKNDINSLDSRVAALSTMEAGSTTGDAELVDGRTDYAGRTWSNIGSHIRGITSRLSNEVDSIYDKMGCRILNNFEYGSVTATSHMNNVTPNSKNYMHMILDIDDLDRTYYVKSHVTDAIPMYVTAFYDANGTRLLIGVWEAKDNGAIAIRSRSAYINQFPALKYIVINVLYSTDGTAQNTTEIPSLNDICFISNPASESGFPIIIVDKAGNGDYESISDAVNGVSDGTTILIMPGVYEEEVHAFNHNVNIVGVDKNSCILKNGYGDYLRPPLEMNIGCIRNMTIIADTYDSTSSEDDNTQSKPYGIHVESPYNTPYSLRIEDCIIKSKWNACIGLGVRYNQTVIIKNCELETECTKSWTPSTNSWIKQGAIFFHNDAVNTDMSAENTSNIIIEGCTLKGANASLSMHSVELANNLSATFINNTLYDSENGVSDSTIYRRLTNNPELCGNYIKLNIMSHGNNISLLNN